MEALPEVPFESIVASWNVKRSYDGERFGSRCVLRSLVSEPTGPGKSYFPLPFILISPVRLPFGEDYHALIRQFHLDIEGVKIEVA